jgi:hypothetical protein
VIPLRAVAKPLRHNDMTAGGAAADVGNAVNETVVFSPPGAIRDQRDRGRPHDVSGATFASRLQVT